MNAGDLIQDRYRLEERLGKGGMGQVWKAHDQRLERLVAIKLIAPQFADEPEFLVRFLREAQSIARISHPNVVAVLDFGEADDKPFLVMEYVPGEPLSGLTGEPMDQKKASAVIAQAADAAGAAHVEGIVHRDIKPANIVLADDGRAKLVDFGIASIENVDRITASGTTIGSPHYISPEQATGESATSHSDVYALGVVLFELLTGTRPFEGDSVALVAMAHVDDAPPYPSEFIGGLDQKLENIVLKCLEKEPRDRYADGRELAEALGIGPQARAVVVPAAAAAAAAVPVVEQEAEEEPVVAQEAEEEPVVAEVAEEEPVVAEVAEEEPVVAQEAEEEPVVAQEADEEPVAVEPDEWETVARETVAAAAVGETLVFTHGEPDAGADDAIPYEADDWHDEDSDSVWKAALLGLVIGLVILALGIGAYAMLRDDRPRVPTDTSTPALDQEPLDQEPSEGATVPLVITPPGEEDAPASPTSPADEDDEEEEEPEEGETIEGEVTVDPGAEEEGEGGD
jgi:eukaryotic-like serine/threonine-protein kinase